MKYRTKSLSIGLSFLVVFQLDGLPAAAQSPAPTQLNIVVLGGEGAVTAIRQRASSDPKVRVEDENRQPVADAAVVFTLPTDGTTGEFGNGSKTVTVMTDSQGQATAQGLRVNGVPGRLPIHVNASYRGLTARTNITQSTTAPPGAKIGGGTSGGHGKLIAILVVLGGAAAGGAAVAMGKGGTSSAAIPAASSPAATPIGVTPGTGTVGAPH